MKPYLFLSCLLLGAGISMPSLADTRVVDGSCNDARFGACISKPPLTTLLGAKDIQSSITDAQVVNVPYSMASSKHKNDVVRWGGLITDIENEENYSLIQVRLHPLDESGRPQLDQSSKGEFVIKTPEFIDPATYYFKHSEITIVGILNGTVKRIINGSEESVPLIVLSDHEKYSYIWSISEEKYRNPDHFTLNLSDPKFFTTSDDRSLLEETLVIAGKTVVVAVVAAGYIAVFSMLGGGICCR